MRLHEIGGGGGESMGSVFCTAIAVTEAHGHSLVKRTHQCHENNVALTEVLEKKDENGERSKKDYKTKKRIKNKMTVDFAVHLRI
jgi:hypothetical protein